MKRITVILVLMVTISVQLSAENNWMIYGGGSLSHLCEKRWFSSDSTYGWGGGAFIGAGYEVNFNRHWSLTPQIEWTYLNNGAKVSSPELNLFQRNSEWRDMWTLNLNVLAGYRFGLAKNVGLKISTGPYALEAFGIRQYGQDGKTKEAVQRRPTARYNVGFMGEVAVETGEHFSYLFRTQYPVLKESWTRKTLTLSLGVRYTF